METISNENRANFLAVAAKYNFFTIGNIPQFYFEDEFFKSRFDFKSERDTRISVPETLKKCKYEHGIFASIREQKRKDGSHKYYYIDHFRILLFDGINIFQLLEYKNKYFLNPMYQDINKLMANVSSEQCNKYTKNIIEPNMIGVFTDRKLSDWFLYCKQYLQALTDCKNNNENKTKAHLQRIEDVAKALGVEPKGSNTYKTIKLENIELRFELLNNGEYLKETVAYTGNVDDVVKMLTTKNR